VSDLSDLSDLSDVSDVPLSARLYTTIRQFFLGAHRSRPWLIAAVVIGALPYLQAMVATFSGPFTIDDDARQYVFWMMRWGDPALFQNDLIADYFASISPPGFRAVYWCAAKLGIDPVLASKILPVLLNALMTVYAFRLGLRLSGGRVQAAFLGAVGLAFLMAWSHIIISGTPRAFGVALLMAFLFYLARRSTIGLAITGALVALTYPPAAALGLGVLGLTAIRWRGGPRLDLSRATWLPIFCASGIGVAVLTVAALDRKFGPIVTMEQIKTEPMYRAGGGRLPLLTAEGDFRFSACSGHVGVVPIEWCQLAERRPATPILLALLLAALFWAASRHRLRRAAGERTIDWGLMVRFFVAGLILYVVAFIVIPKMHMPARYVVTPLRLVGFLAAAMLGTVLAERALRIAGPVAGRALTARQWAQLSIAALALVGFAALYPLDVSRRNAYPRHPGVIAYLREQPKTALIAGLNPVTSQIPTFARRSVLVAYEYAIPIDLGYITRFRARMHALIAAQYAADPAALTAFFKRYAVTHLVLDPHDLSADGLRSAWWRPEHPTAHARVLAALARGETPALLRFVGPCGVFREKNLVVIGARCVIARTQNERGR